MLTLKEASVKFGIPVKRLRRMVRYHRFGRPVRDESGHFLVDPEKVARYAELTSKVAELRAMMDGDED